MRWLIWLSFGLIAWTYPGQIVVSRDLEGHGTHQEPVDAAKADRILTRAFGPHLRRTEECPNRELSEEQARKTGQFVPWIVSNIYGSFTESGVLETIYVVAMGECEIGPAENYGTRRLLVLRGTSIYLNLEYPAQSAENPVSLRDGEKNVWTGTWAACNMGSCEETAAIFRLENGKVSQVVDLGVIYQDFCCAAMTGYIRADIIYFDGISFTRRTIDKRCECR